MEACGSLQQNIIGQSRKDHLFIHSSVLSIVKWWNGSCKWILNQDPWQVKYYITFWFYAFTKSKESRKVRAWPTDTPLCFPISKVPFSRQGALHFSVIHFGHFALFIVDFLLYLYYEDLSMLSSTFPHVGTESIKSTRSVSRIREKEKKNKEERKRKRKLRQKWCALGQHKINICSQEDDKLSSPWQRGETPTHTRGKCPIKAIKEAAIKGWPSWKLFKMQTVVFVIDDIFVCWSISSKSMTFLL